MVLQKGTMKGSAEVYELSRDGYRQDAIDSS